MRRRKFFAGRFRLRGSAVLATPEQQLPEAGRKIALQSRFTDDYGKLYLVRVIFATDKEPPVVITVYRTSKIQKYWRS